MARPPRAGRPLLVRGLSFQWQSQGDTVQVWHRLDEGQLGVRLPDDAHTSDPAMVGRLVELALVGGWRTDEHHTLELSSAEWALLQGGPTERAAELPERPSPEGSFARLTLDTAGGVAVLTASVQGWVQLELGQSVIRRWVEPELVEDLLVVGSVPPDRGGVGRLEVRVGPTSWRQEGGLTEGSGTGRQLAVRLWRLAVEHLPPSGCLADLEHALRPQLLPLTLDPNARSAVLTGRWQGAELRERLAVLEGPWTLDARQLLGLDGDLRPLVRWARRTRLQHVWLGGRVLLDGLALGVRIADREEDVQGLREDGARQLLERRLLRSFRPETAVQAGEVFAGTGAFALSRRWLGEGWAPFDGEPEEVAGFWFTPRLIGWRTGLPSVGLVVRPGRAWVVLADGRVLQAP